MRDRVAIRCGQKEVEIMPAFVEVCMFCNCISPLIYAYSAGADIDLVKMFRFTKIFIIFLFTIFSKSFAWGCLFCIGFKF